MAIGESSILKVYTVNCRDMSDGNGTCKYVLDPDDPETWGGKEGERCYVDEELLNGDDVWSCPHDCEEGEDLCKFHQPVEEKDDEEVVEAFVDVLDEATEEDSNFSDESQLQFIGAQFGEFDLSENPPEVVAKDAEIVLSYVTVKGELNWFDTVFDVSGIRMRGIECINESFFSYVEFGGEADFLRAKFGREAYFYNTEFDEEADFRNVEFGEKAIFRQSEFGGEADFLRAEFGGKAYFKGVEFGKEAYFYNTWFGGEADFRDVEFGGEAKFRIAKFGGEADFRITKFGGEADFKGVEFGKEAGFLRAEFGGEAKFRRSEFVEEADFRDVEFGGKASFLRTGFGGETYFGGGEFEKPVKFSKATFEEDPDFSNIESLAESQFRDVDLTDADFTGVTLHNADFENALLSRATLLGADLRGAKLAGTVIGDVRVDQDTQFLCHPNDDNGTSPHTLSAIRSKSRCVYDPKYEKDHEETDINKAKSVYRALEELAGKAARPRLQSQCFVRRQDLQKDGYMRVMLGKSDGPDVEKENTGNEEENIENKKENPSLEERFIAGARYSRAKVARTTLLYGESPWRIIGISGLFIFAVGLVYPIFGWVQPRGDSNPITWTRILEGEPVLLLESIYFSALTFTTLGMGDYTPVGGGGQALATFNTVFGAILIALLVFVFGRRAAR